MTFDEIVDKVAGRLNLTALESKDRIGERVNERYRRVTTSIGLQVSRRTKTEVTIDPTDVGSELPEYVVTDMEKVTKIWMVYGNGTIQTLPERTYDEITNLPNLNKVPRSWAVKNIGPSEVRIVFDSFPETEPFTINIEGYDKTIDMEGDVEPYMPESFHDILVEGAMSDELRKMEKPELADMAEARYEARLSDLRMFIAKSVYMDVYQGKTRPSQLWYRQWLSRISVWS